MDMQQAITAKRTTKPPTEPTPIGVADRLDALGRLLYGEQWITPMARDLKVHPDMIAEWAWGRRELPPDHPIFAALAVLVHHHDKGVAKAREIMDRNVVDPPRHVILQHRRKPSSNFHNATPWSVAPFDDEPPA